MPQIVISGTVIDFPDTAASPDWSQGIIKFAQLVESALAGVVGVGDVSPQILVIDSYNSPGDIVLPNLAFSTTTVRSSKIRYAVYRSTNTTVVFEEGDIQVIYDNDASSWTMTRERTGDGKLSFDITSAGQVRFNPETIAGTGHTGKLVYAATTLQQN